MKTFTKVTATLLIGFVCLLAYGFLAGVCWAGLCWSWREGIQFFSKLVN